MVNIHDNPEKYPKAVRNYPVDVQPGYNREANWPGRSNDKGEQLELSPCCNDKNSRNQSHPTQNHVWTEVLCPASLHHHMITREIAKPNLSIKYQLVPGKAIIAIIETWKLTKNPNSSVESMRSVLHNQRLSINRSQIKVEGSPNRVTTVSTNGLSVGKLIMEKE